MMAKYDFTETTDFLENSVPLSNLYEDVLEAMGELSKPRKFISKEDINMVWGTLLQCADFIETITVR